MTIRRFDHRARFRAAYLNNTIDQLNQMNKARFYLSGQGGSGSIQMGGDVSYGALYQVSDYKFFCPPINLPRGSTGVYVENYIWRRREAIPTWGHSLADAYGAYKRALDIAAAAATGQYDQGLEDSGWGGTDLTGVTTGDYLTSGGYSDPGAGETRTCNSPGWEAEIQWTGSQADYEANPATAGLNWGAKNGDGAVARVYPIDPGGLFGQPNYISVTDNSASFRVSTQGTGFDHLFQSLPPGSIVTKALLPVKLSNFSVDESVTTTNPTWFGPRYDGANHQSPWDSNSVTTNTNETTGEVAFQLMGRRPTGTFTTSEGRVRRQSTWDALATTGGGISVTTETWTIIDIAGMLNSYLSTWRNGHAYFEFAFFPTTGPAPGSDAKGWLAGMPYRPDFEILPNPLWDDGGGWMDAYQHGYPDLASPANDDQRTYQDYGPFNRESRSKTIRWGGLSTGEGIVEFKYPDLRGKYITATTIVRGDNPILA